MTRYLARPGSYLLTLVFLTGGCTETEKTHEEIIRDDLLVIIEALDVPCGKILNHELVTKRSYSVECESGDIYNISVNPEGRVLID